MISRSRAYILLRERAQELHRISWTLINLLNGESRKWDSLTECRALSAEAHCWEIALYFLGYSTEWLSSFTGYRSLLYVLQNTETIGEEPSAREIEHLNHFESEFREIRSRLLVEADLIGIIISALQEGIIEHQNGTTVSKSTNEQLDQLLWLDEAEGIAAVIDAARAVSSIPYGEKFWFLRTQLQNQIEKELKRVSVQARPAILGCLAHYRHNRHQYSFNETNQHRSYLLEISSPSNTNTMTQIHRDTRNEEAGQIIREILNPFLRRLQEITEGRSLKDLFDDYGSIEGVLTEGNSINVIPSSGGGVCCPLLVALSSRGYRARRSPFARDNYRGAERVRLLGFSETFKEIIKHLAMCSPGKKTPGIATQVVTLICDYWDQAEFDAEYYELLSIYHAQGIEFVFLLEGSAAGHSGLSEIKVNFK